MLNKNEYVHGGGGVSESVNTQAGNVNTQANEFNARDEFEKLKRQSEDISGRFSELKCNFDRLEKNIDKTSTFLMWIASLVVGVFFVTGVLVALDYFVYNEERYEKFIDKTEEMKQEYYTKAEINEKISLGVNQAFNKIDIFKECLSSGGWKSCF